MKCEGENFLGNSNQSCAFIEGITVTSTNGRAVNGSSSGGSGGVASFFATAFTLSAVGLAGYTVRSAKKR